MSIHNLNILLPESNKVEDIPVPVPQDPSKIEEPPKSSSEILSELFGAFNAKPPTLTVDIPFVKIKKDPDNEISSDHDIKHGKKHKKHKKHKKGKKRKRSSSQGSEISDTEKKSKDVKKRKKSKVNKDDQSSSESNSSKSKKRSHKKRKKADCSDSESTSSSDNEGSIKKHVHNSKKSKKKKHKKHDENSSDSEEKSKKRSRRNSLDKSETGVSLFKPISIKTEPGLEFRNTVPGESVEKSLNTILNVIIKEKPKDKKKKCINGSKDIKDEISKTIDEVFSSVPLVVSPERKDETILLENIKQEKVTTPPLPVAEAFVEDLVDSGVSKNIVKPLPEKPKTMGGKIKIKNLKFSSVFEETVRQVEEKAKLKAERYEEGELSDSSSEPQRSPSPISCESVPNSEVEAEVKIPDKAQKKKCRHHHRSRERHRSHSNGRHRSQSDSAKNSMHRDRSKHSKDSKKHDKHTEKSTRSKHRDRSSEKNKDRSSEISKDRSSEINKDSTSEKNRDRSSERSRGRSHEKSKDKSHDKNDSRSHDKTRDRSRDKRSRDKSRDRSHDRNDDRLRDKSRHQRHSSSSQRHRTSHSQSKERTQSGSDDRIDKRKLLEIARKNALSMLKAPALGNETAKVTITAGGKTVDELTDFCKLLSKKDADGHESISSDTSHSSDSESEKPFHHPFQIKDRPSNIIMNIRNSVALPVKTMQEKTAEQSRQLRLQFPVSSGQQHRKTEGEWIPVSPKKEEPAQMQVLTRPTAKPKTVTPVSATFSTPSVFQELPDIEGLDIGSIVSHRLTAMRKLQENPNDCEALSEMYKAQKDMQCWAESKQQPGQFTGSTGVKVLSQAELSSGFQAWARKDQLQVAAPVSSGMGMTLLQKMGWRPGEGLGKNKEGTLQPLLLDIKLDKKGLVAQEELPRRQPPQAPRAAVSKTNLEGKHPVSLLNEYCSRRRHGPPQFDLCFEGGPDHKKHFLVKVKVNGIEYKPALGSPNKKQARAEAALVCLKSLGVLPS